MIYVTAELHGDFPAFLRLLDTMKLADSDTLYVLGDTLDRGNEGLELLMDMAFRANVVPLLGNHDYVAFTVLSALRDLPAGENPLESLDGTSAALFDWWMANGGKPTMEAFLSLDEDNREDLLDYIEEFSLYEEVLVNGRKYLLVHAGLGGFDPERDMEDYGIRELTFEAADYTKVCFEDTVLVTAHTPTGSIEGGDAQRVFRGNNHLAIDLSTENTIAAVRLDDGKEYYIERSTTPM